MTLRANLLSVVLVAVLSGPSLGCGSVFELPPGVWVATQTRYGILTPIGVTDLGPAGSTMVSMQLNQGAQSHVGWVQAYPYVRTAPGDGSYFMMEAWLPGSWAFYWHEWPCLNMQASEWLQNHDFKTFYCHGAASDAMMYAVDTNGNLIYTGGGDKLIDSFNGQMYPNECRTSGDGRFDLCYQSDGNLVLYDGSTAVWASATNGTSPGHVSMQPDGNLVLYDAGNYPRWHSNTFGQPGNFVVVQSNRCALMYSGDGSYIPWGTSSCYSAGGTTQQPPIAPHYFHLPKGGYDVRNGRDTQPAAASAVHG